MNHIKNMRNVPTMHHLSQVESAKGRVTAEEWQARLELAALYRLVDHFRWTDFIYNHISLRLPGEETLLINPFGYFYDEITASCLVKIDLEGNILDDPTGMGINGAGFVIHGAIHAARPDVACVIHTHTRAGCAVAAHKAGLLPISQHAAALMGRIGYHDFEGIATRLEERARLVANLGDKPILILRNHGLLVAGKTAAEAFFLTMVLERACEIQATSLAFGDAILECSPQSISETQAILANANPTYATDWNAALRLVERVAPGYSD